MPTEPLVGVVQRAIWEVLHELAAQRTTEAFLPYIDTTCAQEESESLVVTLVAARIAKLSEDAFRIREAIGGPPVQLEYRYQAFDPTESARTRADLVVRGPRRNSPPALIYECKRNFIDGAGKGILSDIDRMSKFPASFRIMHVGFLWSHAQIDGYSQAGFRAAESRAHRSGVHLVYLDCRERDGRPAGEGPFRAACPPEWGAVPLIFPS